MNDLTFGLERLSTPIGTMLIVTDAGDRLRAIDWEDHDGRMLRLLRLQYGCTISLTQITRKSHARGALQRYFSGDLRAIEPIRIQMGGTGFQRRVWRLLRKIPAGEVLTYGELAKQLDCPNAARAVGSANGANPIGIVVPCHRVIGAGGFLTGYGGGVYRKRWLLQHEGLRVSSTGSVYDDRS